MDLRRHAVFVAAKINQSIAPLVSTTAMPRGDHTLIVAAAESLLGHTQRARHRRARRQLGKVANARATAARRCRIVSANTHGRVRGSVFRVQIRRNQFDVLDPASQSPSSNSASFPSETGCGAAYLCDFERELSRL